MTTYTTKYNVGDICYIVIYSTVEIIPVVVTTIHTQLPKITYDLAIQKPSLLGQHMSRIEESALLSFAEAKTTLCNWLSSQLSIIQSLPG